MQIKDLVVTGDARILGNLYTKDGSVGTGGGGGGDGGSGITYRLTKSGSTITLTGSDGSTSSVTDTDTNTTYTLSSLGAAAASHTHDDRYFTESEINSKLSGYSTTSHTHSNYAASGHTHDDRYYTESEVNSLLNNKANSSHNHDAGNITSGTLAVARGGTGQTTTAPAVGTSALRASYAGTSDMTPGSSSLTTGVLYFVYE